MTQEEINQLMEDSESEPEGQAEAAQTRDLTQIAQPVESNYDNVIELPQLGLAEHSVDSPCYGVLSPLDIETPSVQEKSLQVSKSPKLQFEGDSAESDPSNDLAIISADTSSISHSPLIDWSNEKSILIPGFENETVSLEDQLFGSVIMEASACTSESLCNRLNDSDHTITHPPVVDHFSKSDNDNTLKVETTADRLNDEILAEKATSLGNSISEPQVEDKVPQSDNIQLLGTAESLNEEIVSSKAIALGACISEPQVGDSVPQFDSTQQLATADSLSDDKLAAKASVSGECISEPQIDLQFTLQLDTSDSLNGDAPSIKAGASGNNTREHQTDESVSRLNNNNTHVAADHDESQASEEANTPSRIIKKIYMKDWFLIKKDREIFRAKEWIVVGGNKLGDDGLLSSELVLWSSSLITDRISARTVTTASGKLYTLLGNMSCPDMSIQGFSREVCNAFSNGFPKDWQECVRTCLASIRRRSTKIDIPPEVQLLTNDGSSTDDVVVSQKTRSQELFDQDIATPKRNSKRARSAASESDHESGDEERRRLSKKPLVDERNISSAKVQYTSSGRKVAKPSEYWKV